MADQIKNPLHIEHASREATIVELPRGDSECGAERAPRLSRSVTLVLGGLSCHFLWGCFAPCSRFLQVRHNVDGNVLLSVSKLMSYLALSASSPLMCWSQCVSMRPSAMPVDRLRKVSVIELQNDKLRRHVSVIRTRSTNISNYDACNTKPDFIADTFVRNAFDANLCVISNAVKTTSHVICYARRSSK